MNERIRQLLKHATTDVNPQDREWVFSRVDQAKFAELIVEEVYDYILNATFNDEPWPDRAEVKKHFGVEE
jgi:hypothetical protein